MTTFELQESVPTSRAPRSTSAPLLPSAPRVSLGADERVLLQAYLGELDTYYVATKKFADQEPDEVLQQIAAYSARLCEMRAMLHRSGSVKANQLRTREVDPLIEQLDFQFRIASRLLSAREFEFKASGGGV